MNDIKKDFITPTKNKKIDTSVSTPLSSGNISLVADPTIQRRLSDILVGFHKCIQVWEIDNQASFNTATTLCNLYAQWYQIEEKDAPPLTDLCKRKYFVKLAQTRESLISQLQDNQNKLKLLYNKMKNFMYNIKAIYYVALASDTTGTEKDLPIIFSSWNSKKYFHTVRTVFDMYSKEFLLKQMFYEKYFDFRLKKDDSSGTGALSQCLSIWLHQPYIESRSKFLLDSMLVEAELK